MKLIPLIVLLSLSSCNWFDKPEDEHDPNNSSTYNSCALVPGGFAIQDEACPSEVNEWNHYEVHRNNDGNVIGIELICSIPEEDVPESQAEYNDDFVFPDEDSQNDFVRAADCASGSRYQDSSDNTRQDIWQRQLD